MKSESRTRLFALLAVLAFFGLVWLYAREFSVLYNTIGGKMLVGVAMPAGLVIAGGILWRRRDRFTPWERHLPEVLFILLFCVLFAPLFASLLNRSLGSTQYQSFLFISESPYLASNYGVLKGEKIKPTGYYLTVAEDGRALKFKYSSQPFYPITRPGESVLLPVRKGLFGFRVILLE